MAPSRSTWPLYQNKVRSLILSRQTVTLMPQVPHQRLLLKLRPRGIGDGTIEWIGQWLTDRRQRIAIVDGEVSNWKSALSGVPEGSVLEPLLCLIYINYFDNNITINVFKCADDTNVFRRVNNDGDKQHFQNDLDRLEK